MLAFSVADYARQQILNSMGLGIQIVEGNGVLGQISKGYPRNGVPFQPGEYLACRQLLRQMGLGETAEGIEICIDQALAPPVSLAVLEELPNVLQQRLRCGRKGWPRARDRVQFFATANYPGAAALKIEIALQGGLSFVILAGCKHAHYIAALFLSNLHQGYDKIPARLFFLVFRQQPDAKYLRFGGSGKS